ncbi:MAG TPA: 4Fe-4S binding protein [Alphaproteobacteria bacterium]|jgi:epoxyqueuosine reductase QueG|nr:4Fe-4S binding protein [Alphaproteobacteria bacterium]MDP6271949.1 4Fe-4S binding protein [Alphaproteobacteria bacterium]MDP7165007.1 4Fe-4S binding protein [Alphaproteobacteria bacterium]MDP7427904.1 4Fe-4S binding protein [Alphaproteobacteria bacterium]HJM51151.1 4Fe-4S binding protein [Alphaproteobacteria bacterium]
MSELTKAAKAVALENGADLVGVAPVAAMPEHAEAIEDMLEGARQVVVVASRHSLAAISSASNQVRQYDTIQAYDQSARASHAVARQLEAAGQAALAVPAFIPIDMAAPGKGMRGAISWRQAGYLAGLGSYGENGLLVTRRFGNAVRLAGVVTTAPLEPDAPLEEDLCDHCMGCVEDCPVGALSGGGSIDKKKCGDEIFRYGFRAFQALMQDLLEGNREEAHDIVTGQGLREIWQNFMTGNYYYCFNCQTHCPWPGATATEI